MTKPFSRFFSCFLAFFALMSLTSCEGQKVIVNDIEEKEANEIIVFLASKNIQADKIMAEAAPGGGQSKALLYQIVVQESDYIKAISILNREGLPRKRGATLLTLFSKPGLVPSEQEEKIRYRAGKEEELANTIRKIDGVIDADIQLSLPEEETLAPGAPREAATASVYVKHQGVLDDPNSHLITKIKRWVASSVNGLEFDNVTVIADRARFSDVTLDASGHALAAHDDVDYVSIWSVVVAKESASRFRTLFLFFSVMMIASVAALSWTLWKISLLMAFLGGWAAMLQVKPFDPEQFMQKKDPEEEALEEKQELEEGSSDQESDQDQDFDEADEEDEFDD